MPTPTVARSRSPAALVHAGASVTTQSSSSPIPIPGAGPSDVAPKIAAPNARRSGAPSSSRSHNAPDAMDTESDETSSLTPTDISAESPPESDHILSSTPPPRQSAVVPPEPQYKATKTSLPPSLAPRSWEVANKRIQPTVTSSFLRPFSRFVGEQKSDKSTYKVEVGIKYVDMAQSTLSGYLTIEGLTDFLPTITTYFDGEIIGTKYSFLTKHPSWGATEKTDMAHWRRFEQFEPLYKNAKRDHHYDADFAQKDCIFMRWKEQFLVPNWRDNNLPGASFEGFYYIVFNQVTGVIDGIYFHSKSEKYQKLQLKHVGGQGGRPLCAPPAIEFR